MNNTEKTPIFLTPTDIGNLLHLCYHKSLDFIKYSGIRYVKIGRCYRVEKEVLLDFLSTHKNINTDEFKV